MNIDLFQSFIGKIPAEERKSVLPYVYRKDLLNECLSKEDLIAYWSNKNMDDFDDNEYQNMLKYAQFCLLYSEMKEKCDSQLTLYERLFLYVSKVKDNPYGLLLYCDKETEENAELMISTVNEVFSAIVTFKSNEANHRNYLIEQIIYKIDRVYYSSEWISLCIELQNLGFQYFNILFV